MKKLQTALSKKEKIERLSGNLDRLRSHGDVTDEEYTAMSQSYASYRDVVEQEIEAIRAELLQSKQAGVHDMSVLDSEVRNLDLKHKVGEIDLQAYEAKKKKLDRRRDELSRRIDGYNRLLSVQAAADVGGYIDVPLNGDGGHLLGKFKSLDLGAVGDSLGKVHDAARNIRKPSIRAGGISRVGVGGNIAMAVGVFLPLISFPFLGSFTLKSIGGLASLSSMASLTGQQVEVPFLIGNAWWIVLLLGLIGVGSNYLFERAFARPAMVLTGGVVLAALAYAIIDVMSDAGEMGDLNFGQMFDFVGFGAYLIIIGAFCSVVAGIRFRS